MWCGIEIRCEGFKGYIPFVGICYSNCVEIRSILDLNVKSVGTIIYSTEYSYVKNLAPVEYQFYNGFVGGLRIHCKIDIPLFRYATVQNQSRFNIN